MALNGYMPIEMKPWETASGGKAVVCVAEECSAQTVWDDPDGWYDVTVQYFDLLHGKSHFSLYCRQRGGLIGRKRHVTQ